MFPADIILLVCRARNLEIHGIKAGIRSQYTHADRIRHAGNDFTTLIDPALVHTLLGVAGRMDKTDFTVFDFQLADANLAFHLDVSVLIKINGRPMLAANGNGCLIAVHGPAPEHCVEYHQGENGQG
jgi:hypothetical protein